MQSRSRERFEDTSLTDWCGAPQAKAFWQPPQTERGQEQLVPGASGESAACLLFDCIPGIVISDVWPPEL